MSGPAFRAFLHALERRAGHTRYSEFEARFERMTDSELLAEYQRVKEGGRRDA